MHEAEKLNLEQIEAFLNASQAIRFEGENREQVYGWVEQVLRQQQYPRTRPQGAGLAAPLPGEDDRAEPGAGDAADCPLSGQQHRASGELSAAPLSRSATPEPTSSCWPPSTRRTRRSADRPPGAFSQREYQHYGKPEYERLAQQSRWPICTICAASQRYRERRLSYHQTKPTTVSHRRAAAARSCRPARLSAGGHGAPGRSELGPKASITSTLSMRSRSGRSWPPPSASARPGWSRCWPRCCASFLSAFAAFIPTTAASSSINPWPRLLNKLLIEQTKCRPRHCNDNGLVESKNGAIIRKHMGYGYIAGEHALAIHRFLCRSTSILISTSTQSAMKIFVSCGTLPLRFEAHTSRLPSEVNMGNASKSG